MDKLNNSGIRGIPLKLFSDYLSCRTQCVKIGQHVSRDLPICYGVPQGSILGPTLFLVYLNELCSLEMGGRLIAYADDTALLFAGDTWQDTFESAQLGLNKVSHWLSKNVLTVNASKTKYITFSIRNSTQPELLHQLIIHAPNCSTNGTCPCASLERCSIIKYLGVIIDHNLSYRSHIEHLCGRIRKLIYIFKNLRQIMNIDSLIRVYYALGESVLTYCITSWGGTHKTLFLNLEISQRALLKVIDHKPYRFPTALLYDSLKVLTVRKLFLLETIRLQHEITPFDKNITLKRRSDIVCDQKKFNTKFSECFFPFLGPFIYNHVNKHLKMYELNNFECKHKVKIWLLTKDYDFIESSLKPVC